MKDKVSQARIDGTYRFHYLSQVCDGRDMLAFWPDADRRFVHQGDTLTVGGLTGSLHADGSFTVGNAYETRGVFGTEGGRTIIRDGEDTGANGACQSTYTAAKQ